MALEMKIWRVIPALLLLPIVALLSACDSEPGCEPPGHEVSDHGHGNANHPPKCKGAPATGPVVTADVTNPKEITFSWSAVAGATYYHLLKDADGSGVYALQGGSLRTRQASETVSVHLHDWWDARYVVAACNTKGCAYSTPLSTLDLMIKAIGYFKASNTRTAYPWDFFGVAELSADGSTLVVAASYEDGGYPGINPSQDVVLKDPLDPSRGLASGSSGAVYVFVRDGNHWTQQAYLKSSQPTALGTFGHAIAVSADGNLIAVGEHGPLPAAPAWGIQEEGVALFSRRGSLWTQQAVIKRSDAPGATSSAGFGKQLALSADGRTLAVAAPEDNGGSLTDPNDTSKEGAGAVHVYALGGTSWAHQGFLKAFPGQRVALGSSLAMSGDGNRILAGAPKERSSAGGVNVLPAGDAQEAGAAALFVRSEGEWSLHSTFKAANPETLAGFGRQVAVAADGRTLAIGAGMGGGSEGLVWMGGAVYVFTEQEGVWTQQAVLQPAGSETGDYFGGSMLLGLQHAIALTADGSMLVASADRERGGSAGVNGDRLDNSLRWAGAAYVFRRNGNTWREVSYVKAPNPGFEHQMSSVSMTADGSMIALGAPCEGGTSSGIGGDWTDQSGQCTGAVYLY